MVLVKSEELKKSGNDAALLEWRRKRSEEIAAEKKVSLGATLWSYGAYTNNELQQAAVLMAFLDHLEDQEIRRQNDLKLERRAE